MNTKRDPLSVYRTQWNTGAPYTEHGQRIIAEVQPDGSIRFYDMDRGIGGVIAANPYSAGLGFDSESGLQTYVHNRYLRNQYTPDYKAYEQPLVWQD